MANLGTIARGARLSSRVRSRPGYYGPQSGARYAHLGAPTLGITWRTPVTGITSTYQASFTMTLPTDVKAGDYLVLVAIGASSSYAVPNDITFNTPTGWTRLGHAEQTGDTRKNGWAIFAKQAVVGEANPVLSMASGKTFGCARWLNAYVGADPNNPLAAFATWSAFEGGTVTSAVVALPSVTVSRPRSRLLGIAMFNTSGGGPSAVNIVPPLPMAERTEVHDTGDNNVLEVAELDMAAYTGAYAPGDDTFNTISITNGTISTVSLVIQPAPTNIDAATISLGLTPSGAEHGPIYEVGIVPVGLLASGSDVVYHTAFDAATAAFAFTPSGSDVRGATIDVGTEVFHFVPSANEAFLHNEEFGTIPLSFGITALVEFAPGDFATALAKISPSGVEAPIVPTDAGTLYFHLTETALEHFCVYNPNFEGYLLNKWVARLGLTTRWVGDTQNKWTGDIVEGGVSNPC